MRNPLQRLTMAMTSKRYHSLEGNISTTASRPRPAAEHVLTDYERGIVAVALAGYQRGCLNNVGTSTQLARLRESETTYWQDRAAAATTLFDMVAPGDGSIPKVVIRW